MQQARLEAAVRRGRGRAAGRACGCCRCGRSARRRRRARPRRALPARRRRDPRRPWHRRLVGTLGARPWPRGQRLRARHGGGWASRGLAVVFLRPPVPLRPRARRRRPRPDAGGPGGAARRAGGLSAGLVALRRTRRRRRPRARGPASSAAASSASIASTTLSGVIGASGAGPPRSMPCSWRNARTVSAVVSSWWAIQASVEPSCAHARMRLSCGLRTATRRDMREILCDRCGAAGAGPGGSAVGISRTASGPPRAPRSRSRPPRPPSAARTARSPSASVVPALGAGGLPRARAGDDRVPR